MLLHFFSRSFPCFLSAKYSNYCFGAVWLKLIFFFCLIWRFVIRFNLSVGKGWLERGRRERKGLEGPKYFSSWFCPSQFYHKQQNSFAMDKNHSTHSHEHNTKPTILEGATQLTGSISSPSTSKDSLTVNRVTVWLLWAKGIFAFVDTSSIKNIKIIFHDHGVIKTNVFLTGFIIMYLLFPFSFKFKR